MNKSLYFTANEISEMLGISRAKAYRIVKELNEELAANNYIVIPGRIPRKFFGEKYYGFSESTN